MRLFKKGDRVRLREDHFGKKGWLGFVLQDQLSKFTGVSAQFDKETRGHSCSGLGEKGKCWFVSQYVLDLVEEEDDDLYI